MAVRPAVIMRCNVAGGGDEITRKDPRQIAASKAVTAGPNLAVE